MISYSEWMICHMNVENYLRRNKKEVTNKFVGVKK